MEAKSTSLKSYRITLARTELLVSRRFRQAQLIYMRLCTKGKIKMQILRLTMKKRAGKMTNLYKFITSQTYAGLSTEAGKITDDILELDVHEKKAHDNVWKKRGALAKRLSNVLGEIDTQISAIVESSAESRTPAA